MKAQEIANKTRTFTVPKEMIGKFFRYAESHNLQMELIDSDPPYNIVIDITYSKYERQDIMKLIEMLENYQNKWEGEPRKLWID